MESSPIEALKAYFSSLSLMNYFTLLSAVVVLGLLIYIGTYPTEGDEAAYQAAKVEASALLDPRPAVIPNEAELRALPSFTLDELRKYKAGNKKVYVGIKGLVFDVTGKDAYDEGKNYSVFTGRDASCALAKMNFTEELLDPSINHWQTALNQQETKIMEDWVTYYAKRYPIVGSIDYGGLSDKKTK